MDWKQRGRGIINRTTGVTLNTAPGQRRCDASDYVSDEFGDNFNLTEHLKIKNATKKGYLEATDGDGIDISKRMKTHRGTVQKDSCQTLKTDGGGVSE